MSTENNKQLMSRFLKFINTASEPDMLGLLQQIGAFPGS
jgi:hypothetical protein